MTEQGIKEEETFEDVEVMETDPDQIMVPSMDFGDLEYRLSTAQSAFNEGRYLISLEEIESAMGNVDDTMKKFQDINISLAILSSQRMLDLIRIAEVDVSDAENALIEANQWFYEGIYNEAAIILDNLKIEILKLQQEQSENLSNMITGLQEHIENSKNFGVEVQDAENDLHYVKRLFGNGLVLECVETIKKAYQVVNENRTERIAIMKESMDFVENLMEEAEGIGANIDEPLATLENARSLWNNGEYQMSIYKTIDTEEKVNELIQKQVDKALRLKKTLEDRYWAVVSSKLRSNSEPEQNEAMEKIRKENFHMCRSCGHRMTYLDQWKRWYCYNCRD